MIKQMLQSDAIAYDRAYVASPIDTEFKVLDNAYQNTGREYAKLKIAIQQGNCIEENCAIEYNKLLQLENSPKLSLDFLGNVSGELAATDDPNNNFAYLVAQCMITTKPGFSKSDGYNIELHLLQNGTQQIIFTGPGFTEGPLSINSAALSTMLESGTSLVADTPDINTGMMELLVESQVFIKV